MADRIEYIIFSGFSVLFKILGLRLSRKFSTVLAFVFYFLIPIRKKTTIENLTRAFPEYDSRKIKKIAFGSYKSFAVALIEILYLPWMNREEAYKAVKCPNISLIKSKYAEGNGLILLSAHFGNWEYMAISIALQTGAPFSVVVKAQRNTYVTDWLNKVRCKWGNKIVPLGISIRQIYKELKDKNVVAMVADQRGPSDGAKVSFFGRKAAVYSGPTILALKTGAPILYGIAIRQPDYSYFSEFHEICMDNLPEDYNDKVDKVNQRMTDYLERIIRQHPEQWLWMHKRWKY